MCGIAGFLDLSLKRGSDSLRTIVSGMADTLRHRGPDDSGTWVDASTGIAMGHRCLSILDLSSEGHQPMRSASNRYVLVYNGEIYNFYELKKELEGLGHFFRGHSDTEVMLASFEEWGIESSLKRFIGMFAFALWDRKEYLLYLVRDRLGIKPLYYGWNDKVFFFGSELKSIRAHPDFQPEIDINALALMIRYKYILAPFSIYRGIYKLLPGTILILEANKTYNNGSSFSTAVSERIFWSARTIAEEGVQTPLSGSAEQVTEELDAILRDAVRCRMVADVPLGALLSGGVDSSTVVALMQAQSMQPVKTFSIGFNESGYNEAVYASAVARHLGTEHTELYVTPDEALSVIPELPEFYDEPFSDVSQIPTYLVSRLARREVTVALSGDGGDELFSGYNRYFWGRSLWQKTSWLNPGLQRLGGSLLSMISPEAWDRFFEKINPFLPARFRQRTPGDKLHKLSDMIGWRTPEEMYQKLTSHWQIPSEVVKGADEPLTIVTDSECWANLEDLTLRMMFLDLVTYLPDDILTKVDRASMAVSLEVRVPLLDHRVVEFAWRVPLHLKIRNGQSKWLLRQVLYRYVPKNLIERPKMGFALPIDSWLRGPLRDWAESLLDEKRIKEECYLNHQPIREKWEEHLSGRRNWQYHIWSVLMFQAWLEKNLEQEKVKI
jgi:asparagine synthase (glutamine-hydrolysing)